ncbi:hypothetical protein XENOCAPTIV_010756 [Xenoophorus captivus]|uniref:Immunoglobulin C1-set domain-containing protein n=1 Tax=Xenoophorus captivus TaxID=1517983 RepID=A0ABV0RRG9_9TELE
MKGEEEVTSDVTSTDELPNGSWLYQFNSYLKFTPKPGEKITCMVEHASLREPKFYDGGLLLGLLCSITGFIYCKKKSVERVLVPTTEVSFLYFNLKHLWIHLINNIIYLFF